MLICVTGKSGSGKSTLSKLLAKQLGYKYINVDELSHQIYENAEVVNKLINLFGTQVCNNWGKLDRKKIGQIIFNKNNLSTVEKFNNITWPYIKNLIDAELCNNCIIDWNLLPLTEFWQHKSIKILVKAKDQNKRLEKIIERDKIAKHYAMLRDNAGINYNEHEFDFVFENNYNLDALNIFVKSVVNFITKLVM